MAYKEYKLKLIKIVYTVTEVHDHTIITCYSTDQRQLQLYLSDETATQTLHISAEEEDMLLNHRTVATQNRLLTEMLLQAFTQNKLIQCNVLIR